MTDGGAGDLLVGIDVGTTNTKSAVFTVAGELLATAQTPVRMDAGSGGRVEQDPAGYVAAVHATTATAIAQVPTAARRVVAIGLTGQMGSLIALDRAGAPVFPCDTVLDSRCDGIRGRVLDDHMAEIMAANAVFPYLAPKLLWRRENDPAAFRRIARVVMPHHYVGAALTGTTDAAVMDRTVIGLTGVSRIADACWSPDLCALWDLPMHLLPPIVAPQHVLGGLTPAAAAASGLVAGTPVVAGAGDAVSGWLGAGAVDPGTAVDTSGTAGHLSVLAAELRPDLEHGVLTYYPSAIEGLWHGIGYNSGGGLLREWFLDRFDRGQDVESADALHARADAEAAAVPPGAAGLFFVPHLSGRVCPWDPHLRGGWLGVAWDHQRGHFYRALLEATAFEYASYLRAARRLHPELEPSEVRLIGGGARSALWTRIKAAVLALDYVRSPTSQTGCLGATMIAAAGVGRIDDLASHARTVAEGGETTPADAELHAAYSPLVDRYLALLGDLGPVYRRLGAPLPAVEPAVSG